MTQLIKLDAARRALTEAHSIDELKDVRDKAEALRLYAKQRKTSHTMQNDIAEIKIRAERRLGELIQEKQKSGELTQHGGDRKSSSEHRSLKLSNVGITHNQSSDWKAVAEMPEATFEKHLALAKTDGKELTSASITRLARRIRQQTNGDNNKTKPGLYQVGDGAVVIGDARNMDLSQFPTQYGIIIADPPWEYSVSRKRGVASEHYNTMADDEIAQMPVQELTAENCVLFLWTTWPKLPIALNVMDAWQFEYITGLPWVKTTTNGLEQEDSFSTKLNYGVGFWLRGASEIILMGRTGKPSKPKTGSFMGILSPNLKHSRKPDSVHEIAEDMDGPYLELFARRARPGWTVFGNEIQGAIC